MKSESGSKVVEQSELVRIGARPTKLCSIAIWKVLIQIEAVPEHVEHLSDLFSDFSASHHPLSEF